MYGVADVLASDATAFAGGAYGDLEAISSHLKSKVSRRPRPGSAAPWPPLPDGRARAGALQAMATQLHSAPTNNRRTQRKRNSVAATPTREPLTATRLHRWRFGPRHREARAIGTQRGRHRQRLITGAEHGDRVRARASDGHCLAVL